MLEKKNGQNLGVMQSIVERYYTPWYATKAQVPTLAEDEEQYVYQHHNGLFIVGLTKEHPIIKNQLFIVKVDFFMGKDNRTNMQIKGKRKKGGLHAKPETVICTIHTTPDDTPCPEPPKKRVKIVDEAEPLNQYRIFKIRACIPGQLIEPNLKLVEKPSVLLHKPLTDGYIAIIMPANRGYGPYIPKLLNLTDYRNLHTTAAPPTNNVSEQEPPTQEIQDQKPVMDTS